MLKWPFIFTGYFTHYLERCNFRDYNFNERTNTISYFHDMIYDYICSRTFNVAFERIRLQQKIYIIKTMHTRVWRLYDFLYTYFRTINLIVEREELQTQPTSTVARVNGSPKTFWHPGCVVVPHTNARTTVRATTMRPPSHHHPNRVMPQLVLSSD